MMAAIMDVRTTLAMMRKRLGQEVRTEVGRIGGLAGLGAGTGGAGSSSGMPTWKHCKSCCCQKSSLPGVLFQEGNGWVVIHGKNKGDWRGTAIAYKHHDAKHTKNPPAAWGDCE